MLQEHITAVLGLLPGGVTVYDGQVPDEPALPYIVVWSTGGTRPSTSLVQAMDQLDVTLYVTTVAATAPAARIIQDQYRDTWLAVRPIVAGRTTWKLALSYCEPIREDRDIRLPGSGLHPMYGVDAWRLASVPA